MTPKPPSSMPSRKSRHALAVGCSVSPALRKMDASMTSAVDLE